MALQARYDFSNSGSGMNASQQDTTFRLHRIFESGATPDPVDEILTLVELINPSVNQETVLAFHHDIQDIFSGYYPGFRENGNKYHNLRHTFGVVLATVRLFHGLTLEGHRFSDDIIIKGLLSAYFHDTGLLLRSFDTADTGAEFTQYHEARSISSLFKYLESYNFDDAMRLDCASMIRCTNLALDIESIEFGSPETKCAGQILGTADILAQMADRYYLEQLPFLFQEHRAGGLNHYDSAFDLMNDTAHFHQVIIERLRRELGNVARAMRIHFRHRWDIDRDLYEENIESNIKYLSTVIKDCQNLESLLTHLRRRPPFRS
ncbi:hypothetical protein [Desulfofustis glycolicus]|uniref:HD/PDEase domain-containing protein n=1 Tax=Desulfofustis glycolicus DSM 9705 TaxID=1121409 RepID=A0A1M5YDN9_9BACT|nr:hypothetical protein [Desulfofustis glycolicus]MCB2216925.1 hypothetical protein [Desulfobulbaceae bacterium]SHI10180.1 hypothetical protein SAMN02745124_03915 [Desulfofustis glycolicus DSM 9705]